MQTDDLHTAKLRREVNKVVHGYFEQGVTEVVPGVVFIDEVHLLDIKCFTCLNASLESPMAPTVILALIQGLKRLAAEDEKSSPQYGACLAFKPLIAFTPRYTLQLFTSASIMAQLAGRTQIELEDIGEMIKLFFRVGLVRDEASMKNPRK